MIVNDAHVHIGIFPRQGTGEYCDYSPDVICDYINIIGIAKFIFCSAYILSEKFNPDLDGEYIRQVLNRFPDRAFAFCWVSIRTLQNDLDLKILDTIPYAGIKLHSRETHWENYHNELERIMSIARERGLPIMIHCDDDYPPDIYDDFFQKFHEINISIAHARPVKNAVRMMKKHSNLYTDISFSPVNEIIALMSDSQIFQRVMFGSDLPVSESFYPNSSCDYVKTRINEISDRLPDRHAEIFYMNMNSFLGISPYHQM